MLVFNFHFQPSKYHLILLFVILFITLIILFNLPFNREMKFLSILLFICWDAKVIWQQGLLRQAHSIIGLQLNERSWLVKSNRKIESATLRADSIITHLVSILRFDVPSRCLPIDCVVWRDSLPAGSYRKLVIGIRMKQSIQRSTG